MFHTASAFNQDISSWNLACATSMHSLFFLATSFAHDLSWWNVARAAAMDNIFVDTALTDAAKRAMYDAWGATLRSMYPAWGGEAQTALVIRDANLIAIFFARFPQRTVNGPLTDSLTGNGRIPPLAR
jgi:hypothetical protein